MHCRLTGSRLGAVRLVLVGAILCTAGVAFAGDGGEGKFYFGDLGQAIAAAVIFLLLLAVLGRWAWRPLVAQLHRRETKIAETIEAADRREKEAQGLLAQYRSRLDRAEADATDILADSQKEAVEAREQMLAQARADSRKSAASVREEIERAKLSAVRELHEAAGELAAEMAGKILGKALKTQDHRQLLDESIDEIGKRLSEDQQQ